MMIFNVFSFEIWQAWVGFIAFGVIGIGLFNASPLQTQGTLKKLALILGVAGMIFFGYVLVIRYVTPGVMNSAMSTVFLNPEKNLQKPTEGQYQRETDADRAVIYDVVDKKFTIEGVPYEKIGLNSKEVRYIFAITYHDSEKIPKDNVTKYFGYYNIKILDTVTFTEYLIDGKEDKRETKTGSNQKYPEPAEDVADATIAKRPTPKELEVVISEALEKLPKE